MISLEKIRKIDPSLLDVSDLELTIIRDELYAIAELGFEVCWSQKERSKCPRRLLTIEDDESTINV